MSHSKPSNVNYEPIVLHPNDHAFKRGKRLFNVDKACVVATLVRQPTEKLDFRLLCEAIRDQCNTDAFTRAYYHEDSDGNWLHILLSLKNRESKMPSFEALHNAIVGYLRLNHSTVLDQVSDDLLYYTGTALALEPEPEPEPKPSCDTDPDASD